MIVSSAKIFTRNGTYYKDLYNNVTCDERLDEQLDTGSIQIITDGNKLPFDDFCCVRLTIKDDAGSNPITMDFCGFKSAEKRGKNYTIVTIDLVEPTRILMGTMIDGCKISLPINPYALVQNKLFTLNSSSRQDLVEKLSNGAELSDDGLPVSLFNSTPNVGDKFIALCDTTEGRRVKLTAEVTRLGKVDGKDYFWFKLLDFHVADSYLLRDVKPQTLYETLVHLLEVFETTEVTQDAQDTGIYYSRFVIDENIEYALKRVLSPEFNWEAGTLLWECLCDIGNVINAIPRLLYNNAKRVPNIITFDMVNEVTAVYDL
jgi:hypothetical protein